LESILVLGQNQIEIRLKVLPHNFLLNLAYPDNGILHPTAYSKKEVFRWDVPVSGAYRVEDLGNGQVRFLSNQYYWAASSIGINVIETVRMTDASDSTRVFKEKLDLTEFMGGTLDIDDVKKGAENANYQILRTGKPTIEWVLFFNLERIRNHESSIQDRKNVFLSVYNSFWANRDRTSPMRGVGLRPQGSYGSIDSKEIDLLISDGAKKSLKQTLRIMVSRRLRNCAIVSQIESAILNAGGQVEFVVPQNQEDYQNLKRSKSWDLHLLGIGANGVDPDSAWRIFAPAFFQEWGPTTEAMDQAQNLVNIHAREKMYQEFEIAVLRQFIFIPLEYVTSLIALGPRVKLSKNYTSSWGFHFGELEWR
jgi:ABC-type transport system substrate-binding protein